MVPDYDNFYRERSMKPNGRAWTPTLTLARLFEEQNQFFDALAAYELISQTDSSPAVRERIEALHIRILNDPSNRYDPRIEKLFSPEELAYLKILDHNGFENMSAAAKKLGEGALAEDIFIEEDEDFRLETDGDPDALDELLREIEEQSQLKMLDEGSTLGDRSLRDLMVALLSKYESSTPLAEIRLSDLISVLLDLQNTNPKA